MKKYIIIVILIFCLIGCKKDDTGTSEISFKGNILGQNVSLNENNLFIDFIEIGEPFNSRNFFSMFKDGNTSYQLSFALPNDSLYDSLKFPIQQTGQYGFEKLGVKDLSSPFRFTVSERIGQDYTFYSTYSKNDSNKVILFDIEYETDSTIIISGAFNCNISLLTNVEIIGTAKDVEFKTRFLIK